MELGVKKHIIYNNKYTWKSLVWNISSELDSSEFQMRFYNLLSDLLEI